MGKVGTNEERLAMTPAGTPRRHLEIAKSEGGGLSLGNVVPFPVRPLDPPSDPPRAA